MNRKLMSYCTLAVLMLLPQMASAHFPWLVVNSDGKAEYFFGEGLTDRTYHLPESIAKAKVSIAQADGSKKNLELTTVDSDKFVGLVSEASVKAGSTLVSEVTYGLFRGSRLNYYTIHQGSLPAASAAKMPLTAAVTPAESGVSVQVLWKGKPLSDVKVTLFCDEGHEEGSDTTDKKGRVSFSDKQVEDGVNGILVGHTVKDEAGELNGEAYKSAAHYLTLTFVRPDDAPKGPTAAELRREAHDKRDVWHNFPGFIADVTVATDGESQTGQIRVESDFTHKLDIAGAAEDRWIASKLRSVIGHRKPGKAEKYDVSFVVDDEKHVNGRLVAHNDGSGVFRIKDGVIREVIRKSDRMWFEVSTLEIFETPDGLVLPRTSSTTYRDPKTGDVTSNRSNHFAWTQVGDYFLPQNALTVEVGADGSRNVRRIEFSNHELIASPSPPKP